MLIRPAIVADANAISCLIHSLLDGILLDPAGTGAEPFFASISGESLAARLTLDNHRFWVAELAGAVVGEIAIRDNSHLLHLYVAQDHQGMGVARRLWQQARDHWQQIGYSGAVTVNSSVNAVPLYRHWGFSETNEAMNTHGITFVPMRLQSLATH